MPTTTYRLKSRSVADSSTGNHGGVRGYGGSYLFVEDADGNVVAWYWRERRYRGADTTAVWTDADGVRRGIAYPGKYRNVRERWLATVREAYGL